MEADEYDAEKFQSREVLWNEVLRERESSKQLARELLRLQDEKVIASEIFAETISKYETDISNLHSCIMSRTSSSAKCSSCAPVVGPTSVFSSPQQLSRPSIIPNVPSPRCRSPLSESPPGERKPFMSVASNIVSSWIMSSTKAPHQPLSPSYTSLANSPLKDDAHSLQGSVHGESDNSTPHHPTVSVSGGRILESGVDLSQQEGVTNRHGKPGAGVTFWKSLMGMKPAVISNESRGGAEDAVRKESDAWTLILSNWERQRHTRSFLKLVHKGVPYAVRGEVWKKAVGDKLMLSRALHSIIVERVVIVRKFLLRTSKRYRERIHETLGTRLPPQKSQKVTPVRVSRQTREEKREVMTSAGDERHRGIDGGDVLSKPNAKRSNSCPSMSTLIGTTRISDDGSSSQVVDASEKCEICFQLWSSTAVPSFETISVDLHRTLPRLGVFAPPSPRCPSTTTDTLSTDSKSTPRDSRESLSAMQPSEMVQTTTTQSQGTNHHSSSNERHQQKIPSPHLDLPPSQQQPPEAIPNITLSRPASHAVSSEAGVRPLPDILERQNGQNLYERLRLLLEAFALFRPDIGYVQGMAYIAAMCIIYMDDYSSFVCFSNLMCRKSLYGFYSFDPIVIRLYFGTFDILLREKMPLLADKLKSSQISSDVFLVEWMYTLFTRCLPFDLVSRVWDLFVIEGDIVLFQVSLGIFSHFQNEMSASSSSCDELMHFLSSSSTTHFKSIDSDKFIDTMHSLLITKEKVLKIMKHLQIDESPLPSSLFSEHLSTVSSLESKQDIDEYTNAHCLCTNNLRGSGSHSNTFSKSNQSSSLSQRESSGRRLSETKKYSKRPQDEVNEDVVQTNTKSGLQEPKPGVKQTRSASLSSRYKFKPTKRYAQDKDYTLAEEEDLQVPGESNSTDRNQNESATTSDSSQHSLASHDPTADAQLHSQISRATKSKSTRKSVLKLLQSKITSG